ncbi:MAG: hypothetical protein ACYC4U_10265 [Pirellulaceae bacterium]
MTLPLFSLPVFSNHLVLCQDPDLARRGAEAMGCTSCEIAMADVDGAKAAFLLKEIDADGVMVFLEMGADATPASTDTSDFKECYQAFGGADRDRLAL